MAEPLTAISLYKLSDRISFLIYRKVGDPVLWEDGALDKEGAGRILAAMKWLRDDLRRYGLSKWVISQLDKMINNFAAKYNPDQIALDEIDQTTLSTLATTIRQSVLSELGDRNFVEIISDGLLNYPQLLSDGIPPLFSSPETSEKLDEIVKYDLSESVKCLAFNLCTASAMCSLRAVEGALRSLYTALTGQKTELTWGPLLEEIEKLLKAKGIRPPKLLGYLDYIREIRNSVDHPDKIFSKTEAEHSLTHSANSIEEVYKLIEKHGQKIV